MIKNILHQLKSNHYLKINSFWLKAALVFLLFFILFSAKYFINNSFASADDPFYHAKHALLIEQSGNLTLIEPWLEFHYYNYAPVDLWWGFHLVEAVFIHWFGVFLGVRLFASFLAASIFVTFYIILSKLKAKFPLIWLSLLFFASIIFNYRLYVERPHLLSMIAIPWAVYFIIKKKNFWLFVLSGLYILFYHLAYLIVLLVLLNLAVEIFNKKAADLKPLIASLGGILLGVLLHPHSLNYLYVIFIAVFNMFFLKLSGVNWSISELHPIGFFDFVRYNFLCIFLYVIFAALFLSLKKQIANWPATCLLFLNSSLWFVVTLLAPRGVEYWLPLTILFSALVVRDFSQTEEYNFAKQRLASIPKFKLIKYFLFSLFSLIVTYNLIAGFRNAYLNNVGETGDKIQQVGAWLKNHSEKDSVVFYDNWSLWQAIFFYNDYNHYITGIGPTFLYEYDEKTYWLWINLSTNGIYCDQAVICPGLRPAEQISLAPLAIKTIFRSKYAVVTNYEDNNLMKTLNNLPDQARLVYKSQDLLIYEIL